MRNVRHVSRSLTSSQKFRQHKTARAAALMIALVALIVLTGLAVSPLNKASAKRRATTIKATNGSLFQSANTGRGGKTYTPRQSPVVSLAPINLREIARQESLTPSRLPAAELRAIDAPKGEPPPHGGAPILLPEAAAHVDAPDGLLPSLVSPGPTITFKANESLAPVIPPDTDGAVGTTHIVSASNDRLRIFDRNGTIVSTVTTNSFWSGLVLEGGATPSITDPRVRYDRFNNRFIFALVANPQVLSSATLIAVTATNDPTGTWFRYAIDADPTATAAGGRWADFPSIGFNKDWIVIQNNLFGFGTSGTGYQGPQILAIDKAAIYAGPGALGAVPTFFEDTATGCVGPVFETQLGCGFTMSPSVTEDNTTPNVYLVEDWDATAAQLRITKLSGPVAAPVLTVGTQIPQSVNSWRFNATRIQTSGGYVPQHQQSAHLVSGTRMMANDSRMQNVVFRNGSLWGVHHVMIATTPTAAGVQVGGGGANPADNHTAIQWWQMDPSIETGLSTVPTQRARIEDPTADNCHDGANALVLTPPCSNSAANQHGRFFVFPSISVNQNNDVLIGFSQFGALHYPSSAYAYRANTDPPNTMREPVVFRPGQSNDNLGSGSGATRQNRWGDYSMTQTDPLNDTDFWTTQEYTDQYRDFGIGVACPWATWWALVKPSTPAPSTSGSLIISEFRLRGPQGVRDEFVEIYNPGTTPIVVNTTDNSDGWALAFSTTAGVVSGVAVIPKGTVIPAKGHFLFADNPDSSGAAGLPTVVYSLASYPGNGANRNSDSDTGWAVDLPDNGGLALFKTATLANFSVATLMDSVGFASTPVGLFKEGTGIPDVAVAGVQQTFLRNSSSGEPKDTGNNIADFIFADPAGTLTAAGQRLGAPGPETLDGPIHGTTGSIGLPVFDNSVSAATAPNFVFDPTPVTNGTAGTVTVRRRLVNNTGAPLSRVRLRFVDITTFPQPAGTADLRVLTSSNLTVETPPAQALGGALNTSVAPPVVTFATPLADGANVPIDFVFGVMQTGCFHFIVIAEAYPGGSSSSFGFGGTAGAGSCAPTAAPANIAGRITTAAGDPLAGVTLNLGGAKTARAITDSEGNYRFNNLNVGAFYTVTPGLVNYHFGPKSQALSLLANTTEATFTATRDAVISGNAIDTADYFVRQHYVDFLGREPDESGFNFWSDQITSCGSDAACIERRKINVSAAYFLSIEFQQTGGLVDGLYRASFNRRPMYTEFMPDRAAVARNVIVGQSNWAQILEENKRAFVDAWVQRAAFQSAYGGLTNAGYVDALISNTRVSFSQSERDALVNGLSSGSTRADVLRQIAENERFVAAKRNESFVMMQYFGYLRREPDADGYAFWLNKLNQFNGNFEQAEMVKAFIVSGEYRDRFRQ